METYDDHQSYYRHWLAEIVDDKYQKKIDRLTKMKRYEAWSESPAQF
jgi:hypothetical protein